MNRTAIREQTFKLVYSLEIQKQENLEEAIQLYEETNTIIDEKAKEYLVDAIFGIAKNKEEITKQIETNLKAEWKLERISKIDLAILKLAKKYGEDKSKNFVNGILASVVNGKKEGKE